MAASNFDKTLANLVLTWQTLQTSNFDKTLANLVLTGQTGPAMPATSILLPSS